MSLGRSSYASIVVNNPLASREHAVVRLSGDQLEVADLGSKNGTHVNGRKITEPCSVSGGDRIRIGTDIIEVLQLTVRDPGTSRMVTQPGIQARESDRETTESSDPLELAETLLRRCSVASERRGTADWVVQLVNEFLAEPRPGPIGIPERERIHALLRQLGDWDLGAAVEAFCRSVEARLDRRA